MRVTSTDYAHPYRPWPVAALNALLAPRKAPLRAQDLIAAARRGTGLTELGAPDVLGPLGVLIDSIEEEAALHPVGRWLMRQRLLGVLRQRLLARRLLDAHPAIEALPVAPPVVIVGLQRTGTTLLHRLLGALPGLRALRSWEALAPVPPSLRADEGAGRRLRQARVAERALRYLAPDFFAVHPIDAEAPEEDVLLLDAALSSTVPEATLHVPTYARWVEESDQRPAYRWARTLLQILQWQTPGRDERWILKTPHHLEWLDVLLEVHPGALLVFTHRDPAVTLPSFCSMVAHGRGVFSDQVDPHAIGRHWLRKIRRMVDRAAEVRAGLPPGQGVDVSYEALLDDPVGQVARILERLGRPLTAPDRQRLEATLRAHPQHRYGVHRYGPEPFGLHGVELPRGLPLAVETR